MSERSRDGLVAFLAVILVPAPSRYNSPMETTPLSDAASALFRLQVERRGQFLVDDPTRGPYRELTRAGLMMAGSTFRDGE
jgi:hypothetical protein